MAEETELNAAADNTVENADENQPMIAPETAPAEQQTAETQPAEAGDDAPMIDPEGEKEKPEEGAPESYEDFKMQEGFVLEGEMKEEVHGLFRELNLSQEKAQKLVDYFSKRVTDDKARMLEDLAVRRKGWRAEIRNRPEFAAESANVKKAAAALLKEPDEVEMFKNSWLSDHPVFWKVFSRIGAWLGEDAPMPKGGDVAEKNSAVTRFPVNL